MVLTNWAFNLCAIPFVALGLRLILELTVLCIYIDVHHVYSRYPLSEKLGIIQNFDFSSTISRSTYLRRAIIEVLGSKDGRELISDMRSIYVVLSRYIHLPIFPSSIDSSVKPCTYGNELNILSTLANRLTDIIKKLIYVWTKKIGNLKRM